MGDILNIKQIPFTVKIYAYTCIDHEFFVLIICIKYN